MDAAAVPSTPPIPRQTHQQARRKNIALSTPTPPSSRNPPPPSHDGIVAPASPEVISSLITSLAVISRPANTHFDNPFGPPVTLSGSGSFSPTSGSFGVDYGAFSQPSGAEGADNTTNLDELAAAPPVIRTAKPPSGFSPLTAPKSPTRQTSTGTLKMMLGSRGGGSSRPSSKGSLASHDADAQSIGNLSIERGAVSPVPPTELRRKTSLDSWGTKTARSQRGLMYMSSKERLREKEAEKRRTSVGSDRLAASGAVTPRAELFLAETTISEESHTDSPSNKDASRASMDSTAPSLRAAIPTRESSLHKTGPSANNAKQRSSRRSSKQKPEIGATDNNNNNTIREELDDQSRADKPTGGSQTGQEAWRGRPRDHHHHHHHHHQQGSQESQPQLQQRQQQQQPQQQPPQQQPPQQSQPQRHHQQQMRPNATQANPTTGAAQRPSELRSFSLTHASSHQRQDSGTGGGAPADDDLEDEGAPFPAVAQGRKRDRSLNGRRRSGPPPDAADSVKRTGSKLKRLSGPLSPRADEAGAAGGGSIGAGRSGRASIEDTHVVYERPESADSIDDAVEAYLCSPRLSQKIRHPQTGRIISFSEVGDSDGSAVFCCVGMGLTRYIMAFYDELALTLKLRLITPDRPGVGDSEPYADGTATPLSWPDDVYAICQALKITKFSILAHSAGAIYALATALRMPQHIRGRIHLLAPWIPPSQMSVFGSSAQTPLPPTNAIPTSQRILRALPTPFLKAANSSFMSATSSSISSSLPRTPKRKRKSNANAAKERSKEAAAKEAAAKDAAAAAAAAAKDPASSSFPAPENDKENLVGGSGDAPPSKDMTSMEEMDRIRPQTTSPPPPAASGSSALVSGSKRGSGGGNDGPSGHQRRKSGSNVSASRDAVSSREAAVLAAAAEALAERERQVTYDTRLTHAIWELATTGANPAVDLLVCLERRHTIGFRYVDITRPVVIHHGTRDSRVPVDNVRWLGKTMRRCEVRVLEGEGHGLMASAVVMGGVLMEIAKEWEDWGRLTGSSTTSSAAAAARARDSGAREERPRRGPIGMAR